jgi:biotin operon repressor
MTDPELVLATLQASNAPRTIADLEQATGIPRREVEAALQALRLAGEPIGSGSRGVWLVRTAQEAREMAQRLRERAETQLATAGALAATADEMAAAEMGRPVFGRDRLARPWAGR